jgi:hypothetical protein
MMGNTDFGYIRNAGIVVILVVVVGWQFMKKGRGGGGMPPGMPPGMEG